MAFIEIKEIEKTFFKGSNREQKGLRGVSLDIQKGDFITVLGGNGAGKSTLLNAVAGGFLIDSGSIVIDGKDVTKEAEHNRANYISRVFQNPLDGSAPRMTVAENMALAMKRGKKRGFAKAYTKEDKEFFRQQLAHLELGLENRLDTEMGVLSGGQRQSIALLMAVIRTPKLLLLDEHTAALDPKTQRKVMELTKEKIEEKGITALMITHNIKDALNYGNRLIVMHRGKIAYDIKGSEKEKMSSKEIYDLLYNLEEEEFQQI